MIETGAEGTELQGASESQALYQQAPIPQSCKEVESKVPSEKEAKDVQPSQAQAENEAKQTLEFPDKLWPATQQALRVWFVCIGCGENSSVKKGIKAMCVLSVTLFSTVRILFYEKNNLVRAHVGLSTVSAISMYASGVRHFDWKALTQILSIILDKPTDAYVKRINRFVLFLFVVSVSVALGILGGSMWYFSATKITDFLGLVPLWIVLLPYSFGIAIWIAQSGLVVEVMKYMRRKLKTIETHEELEEVLSSYVDLKERLDRIVYTGQLFIATCTVAGLYQLFVVGLALTGYLPQQFFISNVYSEAAWIFVLSSGIALFLTAPANITAHAARLGSTAYKKQAQFLQKKHYNPESHVIFNFLSDIRMSFRVCGVKISFFVLYKVFVSLTSLGLLAIRLSPVYRGRFS